MPESASLFDLVDDDAKKRAIAEARASVEAGRVVDHTVVSEWLQKLAAGERPPAPLSIRKP
jgi:predicted transcriptional regulator